MLQTPPPSDRRGAWYGAALLVAGLVAAVGAWQMIRHGGAVWVLAPVLCLTVPGTVLAWRARRGAGA